MAKSLTIIYLSFQGVFKLCQGDESLVLKVLQFFGKAITFIAAKANHYLFLGNSWIKCTWHSPSSNSSRPPASKNNWTLANCGKTEEKITGKIRVQQGGELNPWPTIADIPHPTNKKVHTTTPPMNHMRLGIQWQYIPANSTHANKSY